MKILYSGFKGIMHSANGGYNKVTYNNVNKTVLYSEDQPLGRFFYTRVLYHIPRLILEFKTRILRYKHDITHLFYGELTCINYIPYRRSQKHKIVITLHLDIENNCKQKRFIKFLKTMDGIILLSTQQKKILNEKFGIKSVFIPHGFDKPSFTKKIPADINNHVICNDNINVCTIGKNYRDLETLEYIIQKNHKIIFHLIGIDHTYKSILGQYGNVHIYNRLSDDEYYSLIELCDYNFLPVTFATANNTLLEAQSLGITSILPLIDGINDYAYNGNLFYKDKEELLKIFLNLQKNRKRYDLINFSHKYNWNNIYTQLNQYYLEIYQK